MKDKLTFRLISMGFLSGIVFSGIVFIAISLSTNHQRQNNVVEILSNPTTEPEKSSPFFSTRKIDLNLATREEFVTLPGIGEVKADAIIDFREKYGAFEDISELSYVPGIGNTLLNSIQDLVIIN